jgi:hypothetical protein
VPARPLQSGEPAWKDMPFIYKWLGVNWIVHPELPGIGTATEKCFLYHKNAVGHAMNKAGLQVITKYDEVDDYTYHRVSAYMGATLLLNNAIVVMNHDGSAAYT